MGFVLLEHSCLLQYRVFDAGRLMNRLLKAAGMSTVLYRTKAPSSFVALSNIESFVAAAKAFGVPETSLFQPSDLVDGRKGQLLYVLNCINQLGLIVCSLYSHADVTSRCHRTKVEQTLRVR